MQLKRLSFLSLLIAVTVIALGAMPAQMAHSQTTTRKFQITTEIPFRPVARQGEVFFNRDFSVEYDSGSIFLSSTDDGNGTTLVDDAISITITHQDGSVVTYSDRYDMNCAHLVPKQSTDIASYFAPGVNSVHIELRDICGTQEGSSALWFVGEFTEVSPTNIKVSVTISGHFVSDRIQDDASLPLHVQVTNLSNNSPVQGASIRISSGNIPLGMTGSEGTLDASFQLPTTPDSGDFVTEVIAQVDDQDFSSGQLAFYHVDLLANSQNTLTWEEADNYQDKVLESYALRPGIGCPNVPGDPRLKAICVVLKMIDLQAKVHQTKQTYTPMANDITLIRVHKISAQGITPVYLYYESVTRNGSTIYTYAKWTEDFTEVKPFIDTGAVARSAIIIKLASPATVLLVNPVGKRAGFDPTNGTFVFDFPIAISANGDEPYFLVVPNPVVGQYIVQATGTANGSYALSIQTLNSTGQGSNPINIVGTAFPGMTDAYFASYSSTSSQPIFIQRKVQIDIKPGETPNPIHLGNTSIVPVAILTTATFDATKVDPLSVGFGPKGAREIHKAGHIEDINSDGKLDMLLHFNVAQTGITSGSTQACLTGKITSGLNIIGCDAITTISR